MMEILSKFDSGDLIGLVAVAGAFLCGLVCGTTSILMGCLVEMRKLALKQDMIARGMAADEIQTVLAAGSKRSHKGFRSRHCCPS